MHLVTLTLTLQSLLCPWARSPYHLTNLTNFRLQLLRRSMGKRVAALAVALLLVVASALADTGLEGGCRAGQGAIAAGGSDCCSANGRSTPKRAIPSNQAFLLVCCRGGAALIREFGPRKLLKLQANCKNCAKKCPCGALERTALFAVVIFYFVWE